MRIKEKKKLIEEVKKIENSFDPQLILLQVEAADKERINKKKADEAAQNKLLFRGEEVSEATLRLLAQPKEHPPIFTKDTEYYSELERLNPGRGSLATYKDRIGKGWVGNETRRSIYNRLFSNEHYESVTDPANNPKLSPGVYKFKFYHFVSPEDLIRVRDVISEAVIEMKASSTMLEYHERMFNKYGLSYQLPIVNLETGIPIYSDSQSTEEAIKTATDIINDIDSLNF